MSKFRFIIPLILVGCNQEISKTEVIPIQDKTTWSCRTVAQEKYTYFLYIGDMLLPITDWKNIAFADTTGNGVYYSCPNFTNLALGQREVYYPYFNLTFRNSKEQTFSYTTDSFSLANELNSSSKWISVGLDSENKIINVYGK